MNIKELLIHEIESTPDELLAETLDFLRFLKAQPASTPSEDNTVVPDSQVAIKANQPFQSTGRNLLEYLKTAATWQGEDLDECLEIMHNSRIQAEF